jgi:hypothetical protein
MASYCGKPVRKSAENVVLLRATLVVLVADTGRAKLMYSAGSDDGPPHPSTPPDACPRASFLAVGSVHALHEPTTRGRALD